MSIRRWTPLLLVVALSSPAQAVTLPQDGSFAALPGTSVAAQPQLAGTVVEDLLTPFDFRMDQATNFGGRTWQLTGTVRSQVIRAVDGTFDFYWRVLPDAQYRFEVCGFECSSSMRTSPSVPISDFIVNSFNAPEYRVDWRSDGPGEAAPRQAQRFGDNGVDFSFARITGDFYGDSALRTGISSYFLFIDTDAPGYSKSGEFTFGVRDDNVFPGGLDSGNQSWATFAPIPEPQTWALMLAGLACLAGLLHRSSSRASSRRSQAVAQAI